MIYVGIDIASDKHDFMIMTDKEEFFSKKSITISNDMEGYEKLHNSITKFCGAKNDYQVHIGLESTGFYHLNMIFYLIKKNYQVMLINPILTNMYKKSTQVHSPKTDHLDSVNICKYLLSNQKDFKPYTMRLYHTHTIKSLSRERFKVSEELRKVKLTIYRLLSQLFPEYLKLFSNIYQGSAIDIIKAYPSPKKLANAHLDTISGMLHSKCKVTAEKIKAVAKLSIGNDDEYLSFLLVQAIETLRFIQRKINKFDEMIKKCIQALDTKILTIPGIGPVTAGLILGEIGDISNFKNAEKLISFAGLDIEVYESGKFKATNLNISKKGSKYLRYALFQIANVCWRFDPSLNKYYHKKKSENKHYFVVLGHLEKKMIKIIYSVLKSNIAYTPR